MQTKLLVAKRKKTKTVLKIDLIKPLYREEFKEKIKNVLGSFQKLLQNVMNLIKNSLRVGSSLLISY